MCCFTVTEGSLLATAESACCTSWVNRAVAHGKKTYLGTKFQMTQWSWYPAVTGKEWLLQVCYNISMYSAKVSMSNVLVFSMIIVTNFSIFLKQTKETTWLPSQILDTQPYPGDLDKQLTEEILLISQAGAENCQYSLQQSMRFWVLYLGSIPCVLLVSSLLFFLGCCWENCYKTRCRVWNLSCASP